MAQDPATAPAPRTPEHARLAQDAKREKNWKRWGPYLSERQWGTVREDYSADGSVWTYFPFDHARSRTYRWGEDGLLGFCDRECRLCFSVGLWNEKDPILKERLFGLGGHEGNHGEDVKELYYYLDAMPTHAYNRGLYKYPQAEFPYQDLRDENARRGKLDPEYELGDTGVFEDGRYFDVQAEYAKAGPNDILIRLTLTNRGPDAAPLHVLPTLWYRNTWVWGCTHEGCTIKPRMDRTSENRVDCDHETLGRFAWHLGVGPDGEPPELLFTDNETNYQRLFDSANGAKYVKDAFNDRVIENKEEAVNPEARGTRAAAWYRMNLDPGQSVQLKLRLRHQDEMPEDEDQPLGESFDGVLDKRTKEADEYFRGVIPASLPEDQRLVCRQAYAGLLWTKQFYHYVVEDWLEGDPAMPRPPKGHRQGQGARNTDWRHLFNRDVISMPDKWEYPWYAAWDLGFHMIPFCRIDPDYAKSQLRLFLREWYMHPNGQIPAYEFNFSDVNPPVHAWACWRVYKLTAPRGQRDRAFLASTFQKLLMNFTWWVNRKDPDGNHVFAGGFLGLDNIGVFDRNRPLPSGQKLTQADGTGWMAFYCTTMLAVALELAEHDTAYADMASKFFEHFVAIADAINTLGGDGLWDEEDGFYYDQIRVDHEDGEHTQAQPIRLRSLVGLIPLIAVEVLEQRTIDKLPGFRKRMNWLLENQPQLARHISCDRSTGQDKFLLAIPSRPRLESVLSYLLDENEFLSPYGLRSLSKYHENHPYTQKVDDQELHVHYTPGQSESDMFGGNSNWRGPIWFPTNYLIIEALQRYHHFYGDDLTVECPTGSGNRMNLLQVSREIQHRLTKLFDTHPDDEHFKNLLQFHEYFHAETGQGLGAAHQTGWTSLVAQCLEDLSKE